MYFANNLTRRMFLGGMMAICLSSCQSPNSQDSQGKNSAKGNNDSSYMSNFMSDVRTDEQYTVLTIAQNAITVGKFSEYLDLEISLKDLFHVSSIDYHGIETTKNSDYVRTRYAKRHVEYPNNQSRYDETTLSYEYIDCNYENGILDTRQSEQYDEWPKEHLRERRVIQYDDNGYEESYHTYYYNDEGELTRELELLYGRDEEGRVLTVSRSDTDEYRTSYREIARECDDNGQTLWHVKNVDGRDECRCEYEYDSEKRLTKKTYESDDYSEEVLFSYDEFGRLTKCVKYENDDITDAVTYKYYDEYHRIEAYKEMRDPQHCDPMGVYQFNSKGFLVYQSGGTSTTLNYCDKRGNRIEQETYLGDELVSIEYRVYDESTGLLCAQSTVSSLDNEKEVATAYVFSYEGVDNGKAIEFSDIDEIVDLELNINNILGPDFWDIPALGFGENRNTGNEIIANDASKYREALEQADKLSEPKELPPYSARMVHNPISKQAMNETGDSLVGTWRAQAYAGGIITLNVMSDNTYTINGTFPEYEWNDSGEWRVSNYLEKGIEMPGTEQPIGYALYYKDSSTYLSIDGEELPVERID